MANPGDVFIALGSYLPQDRRYFPDNPQQLSEFLYSQRSRFPNALSCFNFNTEGSFPESEELRQALVNLSTCRAIERTRMIYHFTEVCDRSMERFAKKRLTAQESSEIETLAQEFANQLSVKN